ncbi:MAG: endolytic transglycosylase MltG [Bacteroidetes bacterium]|nr:endolytic transglycosylase MltG [Bacteroidota bacterium]
MAKGKSSFLKKIIIATLLIIIVVGGVGGYYAYKTIYQSNVNLGDKKSEIIYIPTGSTFDDVIRILGENNILKNRSTFELLAEKKKYKNAVKPGKYRILANMSNNALVNLLKAGIQEPIKINFNGLHTVDELLLRVGRRIEADSNALHQAIRDNGFLSKYGFNQDNVQALFIPENYEFYWNTSVEEFFDRMAKEYKFFWNEERKKKAKAIGYSQTDITTLASIVQGEQCCDNDEKKIIAGLYLNRLNDGMALQSDPTVIYAIGDFTIQRVSFEQTRVNSPYNTYVNKGLPPGPIGFAQQSSIDAVLNYEKSDYMYMCAKEDLSGKHYFAKTYEQHCVYAKKYRDALNAKNIH